MCSVTVHSFVDTQLGWIVLTVNWTTSEEFQLRNYVDQVGMSVGIRWDFLDS